MVAKPTTDGPVVKRYHGQIATWQFGVRLPTGQTLARNPNLTSIEIRVL